MTSKVDLCVLKEAYRHRGRGYLSESVSADLLRTILDRSEHAFLIEPALTPWIMEGLVSGSVVPLHEELLTPREKEILTLLNQGMDRPTIARTLCITEATLKTHLRNIARKRKEDAHTPLKYNQIPVPYL